MTDQEYLEFKARAASDPFWKRLALAAFKEEIMNAIPERPRTRHLNKVRLAPPGTISYREAAKAIGVRHDSICRSVSNGLYSGKDGFLVLTDLIEHTRLHGRKAQRTCLEAWLEARNAKQAQREGTPVIDLFAATA